MNKQSLMKMNNILKLIGSAALAVLVIHLSATIASAGVAVSIGQNFTGNSSSNSSTPDPSGAASEDYVVACDRDSFAVHSKADGSVVKSMNMVEFWTAAGVPLYPSTCGTGPRVVYDPGVQRWFVAQGLGNCDLPPASGQRLRLAVSASANPTGVWSGVSFPDSPGSTNSFSLAVIGMDAQGVYLSCVVFPTNTSAIVPAATALWSLPKADLLAIPPVITNRTSFGLLDPAIYGYGLDPAICLDGTAGGDVLATGGTGVDQAPVGLETNTTLVALDIHNAGGPGPAYLGSTQTVLVPPYTSPFDPKQPDGSTDLVDWDASFTANVYRVGNVLFAAQGTQYGPHAAVRWYRLSALNHTLLESGTIADPDLDFYLPSIAANTNGTVVLAFNGSGADAFVSCYAMVGQTVNGVTTFGNLLLLKAGTASYQNLDPNGNDNWSYYSTTCVDPADPNVFWTINAYPDSPTTWATQITQLLTSPSPRLSVANAGSNLLLSWPVTAVPFVLLSAPSVHGSWSAVAQPPVTNGTTVSVLVPATNTAAFFRLQ